MYILVWLFWAALMAHELYVFLAWKGSPTGRDRGLCWPLHDTEGIWHCEGKRGGAISITKQSKPTQIILPSSCKHLMLLIYVLGVRGIFDCIHKNGNNHLSRLICCSFRTRTSSTGCETRRRPSATGSVAIACRSPGQPLISWRSSPPRR